MAKNTFYAVQKHPDPTKVGIYSSWTACEAVVKGVPGVIYKGFATEVEATAFLGKDGYDPKPKPAEIKVPDTPYAFVDGSYNPNTGVAGYGGFLYGPLRSDGTRVQMLVLGTVSDKEFCKQRNVAGEVAGATRAVELARERRYDDLTIIHDYMGIASWANGSWKAGNAYTQRYAASVLDARADGMQIRFVHAQAHTGIEGNEMADRLAKEAVGVSAGVHAPSVDFSGVERTDAACEY